MHQLPLAFAFHPQVSFGSFISGPNGAAIHSIRQGIDRKTTELGYLWGEAGVGKSHLLQSACRLVADSGLPTAYVPMVELIKMPIEVVQGLEQVNLLAIDDLQAVAGVSEWEQGLFNLFNRAREQGVSVLFAARLAPDKIGIRLADLISRLQWGPVFHIQALSDSEKIHVLTRFANERGLEMGNEVGLYLLHHYPRDLKHQLDLLDRLDQACYVEKRRLTIPFVRQVLGAGNVSNG